MKNFCRARQFSSNFFKNFRNILKIFPEKILRSNLNVRAEPGYPQLPRKTPSKSPLPTPLFSTSHHSQSGYAMGSVVRVFRNGAPYAAGFRSSDLVFDRKLLELFIKQGVRTQVSDGNPLPPSMTATPSLSGHPRRKKGIFPLEPSQTVTVPSGQPLFPDKLNYG